MKTFYSIIIVSPNNVAGDKVAIGMVLFDEQKIRYYFSDKKRKIASRLIEDKSLDLNTVVKQFIHRFEEINSNRKELLLFSKQDKFFEASYFDHLHRYSQGLIGFSSPFPVYDQIDDGKFGKLIQLVFTEQVSPEERLSDVKEIDTEKRIFEKLILPVQDKVHTQYKFSNSNLPSIYFSFEMDCIGMNGSLIGAKQLSFDKSKQTLDIHLSHYFALLSTLTNKYNKSLKENDFFLISDEPTNINSTEHQVWESVNSNELIKVIPSEKAGEVAELIIGKKAHKFLD